MMAKFIEPYNPNWKTEFESIRQIIYEKLSDLSSQDEKELEEITNANT